MPSSTTDAGSANSRSQPLSVSPSSLSNARLHSIVVPTLVNPRSSRASLKNWGGTFHARPDRVFAPKSVEQCQAIVELARREGMELRAVGRMHSPSDLMFSRHWVVRMAGVKGLLELDHSKPTVTVLAGTYISDIHEILGAADPPLAMTNLGSISEQTIGGLISTASHGTGIHFPVISTAVESLRLICALPASQGGTQLVRCSRTERPELFNASLCGLGLTGLIVSVELRVGPAFRLRDVSEECPFDFVFGRKTGWPAIEAIESSRSERLPQVKKSRLPLIGGSGAVSQASSAEPPRRTRQSIGKLLAQGRKLPPARHDYLPSAKTSDPSQLWPARPERGERDVKVRDLDDEDDEETREAQKHIESIVESSQHVRMMWFPQAGMVTVRRANRTFEPPVRPTLGERLTHRIIGYHLTQALLFASRYHQSLPPRVARLVYWLTHPASPSKPSRSLALASTMDKGTSAGGAPAGVSSIGRTTEAQPHQLPSDVQVKLPSGGPTGVPASPSSSSSSSSVSAGGAPSGVAAIGRTTEQAAHLPSSSPASTSSSGPQGSSTASLDIDTFSRGPGVELTSLKASSKHVAESLPPLDPRHARRAVVNTSHLVFNMDCLFPQYTDEWAIPYEHTAACLRAMREWLDEEERNSKDGERIHFPVEVRWTDADAIWLSHCQGRRSCFIGVIQFRPYNQAVRYRRLFAKFETLMRHFAGRPHWAKAHTCGPLEMARLYPHLGDFLEVRQRVDPEGVFLNPYTRRHLIGELGDEVGQRVFKSRL